MRPAGATVVVLATLAGASLAPASSAGVGRKVLNGRGYATSVTVAFTAPPGYTINGSGYENWNGPLWKSLVTGNEDESNLHFDVHPDFTTRSAAKAAQNKVGLDMGGLPTRQVAASPIKVPHVVRGKKVGVIPGFFVIRQVTNVHYEGWFEGALAFSLGKRYPVLVADVDSTSPDDDETKRIQDTLPSAWNRRIVEAGIRAISVEGNLAPANLSVRVLGRRVTGRATDVVGHPVVAAKVKLRGPGGKTCCAAVTSAAGAFTLIAPRSAGEGAFRLSATAGGATLTRSIRIQ